MIGDVKNLERLTPQFLRPITLSKKNKFPKDKTPISEAKALSHDSTSSFNLLKETEEFSTRHGADKYQPVISLVTTKIFRQKMR